MKVICLLFQLLKIKYKMTKKILMKRMKRTKHILKCSEEIQILITSQKIALKYIERKNRPMAPDDYD